MEHLINFVELKFWYYIKLVNFYKSFLKNALSKQALIYNKFNYIQNYNVFTVLYFTLKKKRYKDKALFF